MRIIKKMLKMKAVYWEPGAVDQFAKVEMLLPVDIKCRWEDERTQMLDAQGKEVVYDSIVYVDRDVKVGGKLLLAELKDLDGPKAPPSSKRIEKFDKIPTLNCKKFLRVAYL